MKKLFFTAMLIATMNTTPTFAAMGASLELDTPETPTLVYHANQHAEDTATLQRALSAREASVFVTAAKRFQSTIQLQCSDKTVNAKSIMMILSLGLRAGSEVTIVAEGSDAQQAVDTLKALIEADFPAR